MDSSPLLRNSKFLKREVPDTGGDSDAMNSTDDVLFRDYLKQQIDHLMTGDAGRDGVAEGRRGTHVEVLLPIYKQHPPSGVKIGSYIYVRECTCLLKLEESCVQGQISEHIFAQNVGHCVYYPSNIFRNTHSFEN